MAEQTEPSSLLTSSKKLMTLVTDFSVLNALLVVLPESLDTGRAFVFVSHIIAPRSLNATGHIVPIAITHGLKGEQLRTVTMPMRWVLLLTIAPLPSRDS